MRKASTETSHKGLVRKLGMSYPFFLLEHDRKERIRSADEDLGGPPTTHIAYPGVASRDLWPNVLRRRKNLDD